MSVTGRTFDSENVSAKADGGFYNSLLGDGILWGCAVSKNATGVFIADGEMIIRGRIVSIANHNVIMAPTISNGYGRVILNVDLSQPAGNSNQCYFTDEYSTTQTFNNLVQQDVNASGILYQMEVARVSVVSSQVSAVVSQIGKAQLSSDIINSVKLAMYPVGAIYMSTSNTNPATLFGGTWERWGQGRVPVGLNENDTDFNTSGKTGGAKTVKLTTEQMPSHTHTQNSHNHTQASHNHTQNAHSHSHIEDHDCLNFTVAMGAGSGISGIKTGLSGWGSYGQADWLKHHISIGSTIATNNATTAKNNATTATNKNTGGGQAHSNVQPYITCYMWKRVG